MAPGTTLDDPVNKEHLPDLGTSLYEVTEYLERQQAYDLFDYLLRDLLVSQPKDPLQHMIDCLQVQVPSGPLQVFVCSPPGVGRSAYSEALASKFGLTYISAGKLLKDSLGVDVSKVDLVDDKQVSDVVLEAVKKARSMMQGFVLDGFPRTRMQTSLLQEHAIAPTHVLVLKATAEQIVECHGDGDARAQNLLWRDDMVSYDQQMLQAKLNLYTCHTSAALEAYANKTKVIDAFAPADFVASEMERTVRMLPRSRGPGGPPRVLMLGPRGSGVREHASRLASRLGVVFVDGERLQSSLPRQAGGGYNGSQASSTGQGPCSPGRVVTSIDLPKEKLEQTAAKDALGDVGVRLRQPDCKKHGYVLCGFVSSSNVASVLAEDLYLRPTRVIALRASVNVCLERLRHLTVDKVTGKVWTSRPQDENLRKRLVRSKEDMPDAVAAASKAYDASLPSILDALGSGGRCMEIQADGEPEDVYVEIVEFVERPLPLGSSEK